MSVIAGVTALGLACSSPKSADTKPAVETQQVPQMPSYGLTPEQSAQVLVKVGETKITLGEFAERLGNQLPYLRARYHSPERRREFLENMVRFELLAGEAEKRGYDKTDDVDRVRKQVMVQQMMQDLFDKGGIKLSDVSDAEIKAYYDANPSEFDKPAQRRASEILFKDKAAAESALTALKQAPQDMELFRKLAQTDNTDPQTKDSFGDLRFFSETRDKSGETDEPERPDAVRKAVFSLKKIGDVYPDVIQSERGFHVVKLTGMRDAVNRSLEDARRMIQNKLWRSKREAAIEKFVADLRAKANVKENPEALAKVRVTDGVGKSATPGSADAPPPSAATPAQKK
ncbi:MAG TPA: peptidyl-prolyl cis-trans isomerase [Polyangiales bacterium]|nr:peptidyl-prolyl cis-trans isomerase [Polyangiales bacterium]